MPVTAAAASAKEQPAPRADRRGGIDMTESILVALISGGLTLLGVIISNNKHQAVSDAKMEELTREVREHNNFARRVPVVEEQIKVINHRLADLEEYHK